MTQFTVLVVQAGLVMHTQWLCPCHLSSLHYTAGHTASPELIDQMNKCFIIGILSVKLGLPASPPHFKGKACYVFSECLVKQNTEYIPCTQLQFPLCIMKMLCTTPCMQV